MTIDSPTPSTPATQIITAPTIITGSISAATTNFDYTVTAVPFDGSPTTTVASVTNATAISHNTIATFDPTMLADGDYTLVVTATDHNTPALSTSASVLVHVEAKLKLGRETLSVTDLSIPVAGVPLTITRSYDSLEAGHSADFGYGWRLSIGDSKLVVDLSTTFDAGWGGYPAFTASPTSSTRVFITTPDGTREGFTFTPYQTAIDSFGLPPACRPGETVALAPTCQGEWPFDFFATVVAVGKVLGDWNPFSDNEL